MSRQTPSTASPASADLRSVQLITSKLVMLALDDELDVGQAAEEMVRHCGGDPAVLAAVSSQLSAIAAQHHGPAVDRAEAITAAARDRFESISRHPSTRHRPPLRLVV